MDSPYNDADALALLDDPLIRRPAHATQGEHSLMAVQQLSGRLDTKQLAKYLKRSRKSSTIRVHRGDDGSLLIADGVLFVQAMLTADLHDFTPPEPGLWGYHKDEDAPRIIGGPDLPKAWATFRDDEVIIPLKAMHTLYEVAHYKKPSNYYRKLLNKGMNQEALTVWVDRAFLDCFAADPDDLNQFVFELVQDRYSCMVRVSCAYGITGFLMPAQNIPNE